MENHEFLAKLKVIGDATRLAIIQMLSRTGTICACKILEKFNITQGTLSHHMKILTESGLVTSEKVGKWCYYTLVYEKICELAYFLEDICCPESIDDKKCKCCE